MCHMRRRIHSPPTQHAHHTHAKLGVSFTNNSNVPIDVIIFTFYSDQLTIDVETGIVTK